MRGITPITTLPIPTHTTHSQAEAQHQLGLQGLTVADVEFRVSPIVVHQGTTI